MAKRAVAALQRLAGRDGASLRPMTPVLGLEPHGDGVRLRTPDGEIAARVAIVTAGGWAGGLLGPALPLVPPLTVTLQQVHYYAAADPGARWPTFIEWSNGSHGWYAVPVAGGAPGVKVARHHPGRPVDPRTGPFTTIDAVLADAAARYTSERLPGLLPTALHAETCLYTTTADQDFVLDRAGPIVVGGGGSGHAFKFGPLLGQILADLALGKDVSIPRERFSLSRAAPG
jgi:sarcosine oxidase